MTDTSLILGLPYIQPSQAQKHVTHNEALRMLDAVVQLAVEADDLTTPPTGLVAGDRYLVAAPGQGAWAGHDAEVAVYDGVTWTFIAPQTGWQAYVKARALTAVFDGTVWQARDLTSVDSIGVNAASDLYNRLTVASEAVLLTHDGAGHQLKVNKAATTDTASLVYQTGFSGRAEMGLTGNDDFAIKVSADGATWFDAVRVAADTGEVHLPLTPARPVLTGPRTYYVDPALGSDANDGLSAGAGAFATITQALAVVQGLDAHGHVVTVDLANGTYALTAPLAVARVIPGAPRVVIEGNVSAPGQVVLESTQSVCDISAGTVALRGVRVQSTSPDAPALLVRDGAVLALETVTFGASAGGHILARGGHLRLEGDYTVAGDGAYHIALRAGARAETVPLTVTFAGTPNFAVAYLQCWECSVATLPDLTFAGSAAGPRYSVSRNSVADTGGGGSTYFPGSANGSTSWGGRYF